VWFPSAKPLAWHSPFCGALNDKEFRRLRTATNAPRVGSAQAFEKA